MYWYITMDKSCHTRRGPQAARPSVSLHDVVCHVLFCGTTRCDSFPPKHSHLIANRNLGDAQRSAVDTFSWHQNKPKVEHRTSMCRSPPHS
ncbi:hypothetical protein V5799_013755 [Amblyomma americanum]|uniref:Uncharacterized protein n=1 Tax=Amblyomma americanum TaxID=6943 RepID=A0AAQ4E4Z7_AMBAM